ncbi:hypothetical protein V6N13_025726 [Hibiscus sabdariffa]
MHILLCAIGSEEFAKVSSCDNAKEIWDKFEVILEDKLVRKLIYSLPKSWDSKKTATIEANNLKELKLDKFIGSLLIRKLMSKPLIVEKEKKVKEQGIDVNLVALKSSKKHKEDSSEEKSEEEDDEMTYLFKNLIHEERKRKIKT